ncbi:WD40-repeat-containing domain protein [Multifurca ochricompacta]|uniref:Protein HIR n=1 Tax=Multifurca ochricompacta TaxID=376703 RepID=A0AAD4QQI2_9AGAM|nr:WD40-repeat-containing domain protein [Multifurca ochricompacta]
MKFTKPSWVIHSDLSSKSDQPPKRLSIFSVHVHPDGSRIATGGLDAKIRIWSTKPILNSVSERSNRPPKSLCTLTMHTGPVLCVRWAHSGRWLASGSDDEIVMIWDLDPTARGKVWGSDEVNLRLTDVTDLAWSPEDRYLASVGLDSQVLIWSGYTLERMHRIDQHHGFVKGVCWDPVGEFLATQSDDRSVKIWRTMDWELEAEVRKPFEDSPGSTFFRRLSWSPDGAHITASNATNNKGFVFIAAVIARNSWTSEISLVGHENTVEVAAYNPHIFLRNITAPVATSNICSVVALGADDRSVSIWQTKSARPIIVAKEVFERQIMDLSWSWDGLTLYAVSSDGTLAAFSFDPEELEGIAPHSVQQQYLKKFGFNLPPLPEGWSHTILPLPPSGQRMTPPPSPNRLSQTQGQNGFGTPSTGSGHEVVNTLIAKRNTKKSQQQFRAPLNSPNVPGALVKPPSYHEVFIPTHSRTQAVVPSINPGLITELSESSTSVPPSDRRPSDHVSPDITTDVPIDSFSAASSSGAKRKLSALDVFEDRPAKARTLGGDRARDNTVNVIERNIFAVPPTLTYMSLKVADAGDDMLECKNAESGDQTEISYVSGKTVCWLDYLPFPAVILAATNVFCAVGMSDGTLNVYSPTGRRIMPTITLDGTASFLSGAKFALVAMTCTGVLYSWNIKKMSANFAPTSVRPLLSSPNVSVHGTTTSITSLVARPNGSPVLSTTSGVTYSYDSSLYAFVKLSETWWAEGSDAWSSRPRTSNAQQAVVASIESAISERIPPNPGTAQRPQWWTSALTLGHLESKLHAARVLDSSAEYKQTLLVYAKKIADEGFRNKAEELIKELFGPIYWRPGMAKEDSWNPMLLGHWKRDLLKEVLQVFGDPTYSSLHPSLALLTSVPARSKTLAKLGMDWQELLKKATMSDD